MEKRDGYIFISGATGGIGKAFAERCIQEGNLFLTGRSEAKLASLKEELLCKFPARQIDYFACDLTNEKSRAEMFSYIERKGYNFSMLCNVAGVDTQKGFEKYTQSKIVYQCRVNLESVLSVTKFILECRTQGFKIVTIGSISAVYPMPYFAIYSATKKALESFFSSLRVELREEGVKVTVVEPGGVYTRPDIIKDIKGQGIWGKLSAKTPAYIAEKSICAVKRNKRVYRPGFWNKFIATVPHILPLGLRMRFIARRWKKLEKDAF